MDIQRSESLDLLRGLAISGMVLVAGIPADGVMPAWMYHAQVPPPKHVFQPIAGITWVDLVFPFFLFAMGAAFPFAFRGKIAREMPSWAIGADILKRFVLLTFFAIFVHHVKPLQLSSDPQTLECCIGLLGFILLFGIYLRPFAVEGMSATIRQIVSFAAAVTLLSFLKYPESKICTTFCLKKSDIILLILANMAFFGSILYWATWRQPILKWLLLPILFAIFLGKDSNWYKAFFIENEWGWLYRFEFLKYLFIIVPGIHAGELLVSDDYESSVEGNPIRRDRLLWIALLAFALVPINLWGLFTRNLMINAVLNIVVIGILELVAEKNMSPAHRDIARSGAFLLILGLVFEGFQGGIKKDPATFSYFFVTSGLAFYQILCYRYLQMLDYLRWTRRIFSLAGQNPMVAYVSGQLIIIPFLRMTGLAHYWVKMNANAYIGFFKGCLFTSMILGITLLTVRHKMFWKT
jgi:predicted acyltransferase